MTRRHLLLITLICAGCSDVSGWTPSTSTMPSSSSIVAQESPPGPLSSPYALSNDADWSIIEAVTVRPGDPTASIDPSVDWYVEYTRRGSPDTQVLVTGHSESFDATRAAFEQLGYDLVPVTIADRMSEAGTIPNDPSSPPVIVLRNDNQSMVVLSYQLDVAELAMFAATLEPVTAGDWAAIERQR